MSQLDIDKLLEDIRNEKKKNETNTSNLVEEKNISPVTKNDEEKISDKDKKTLSNFLNGKDKKSEDSEKEDVPVLEEQYSSKTSEDYMDENFMKFFTQSVIVTKTPEETGEIKIKKKKSGFFRKKYITDSLTLNVDALEEKIPDLPKSTTPVNNDTQHNENIKSKKSECTEKNSSTKEIKEEKSSRKHETSLNDILKEYTDADSLAAQILKQKRGKIPEEAPVKNTKEPVKSENPIVNSIYTSVIEAQAEEQLKEDITSYIPDIEQTSQDETKQNKTFKLKKSSEISNENVENITEKKSDKVFEEYISGGEFFKRPDDESGNILEELLTFKKTLSMRIILGFVCCAILFYFNTAAHSNLPMPSFINPMAQPMMFSIACTIIYAIAFIGFLPTVIAGFIQDKKAPAPDSLVSLGAALSLLQLILMIVFSSKIDLDDTTIFASYMCLALSFNAIGKRISTDTIIKNLTLANMPEGLNAGYIIKDSDAVKKLARSLDEKVPQILVSRKTGSISNFVKAGFSIHKSDYTARKLAVFTWGITGLCFIIGLALSKNVITAVFCAAGAAAIQSPLSNTLIGSVPSAFMQKNLEKVGALVNGWQGIDQLSKTTHVNFDAKHLFPKGTVILHGIKTFERERLDLAILYAASILIEKCNVLKPVFMEVIEGKTSILYPVDSCEYIECQGYVAWVNDNRVIVGNRTLMEKYDVPMPPISMEAKFTSQGRKPIYLAVGGKLFGMFVLSYRPDSIVKENLDKLMEKGVNIILSSSDFNVDSQLIEDIYGIPADCVNVLNQREASLISQFTAYTNETEACMAHLDSLPSLVSGFFSAESAQSAENICSIMQVASVLIAVILCIVFTWSQTIMSLPLTSILLINFGFMGLTMLASVVKKY